MPGSQSEGHALILNHRGQRLRIEPWGVDSLRVRATPGPTIRNDLPGALLPPTLRQPEIDIDALHATIRNGRLASGKASCAIARRPSCSPWRVSTNGADCRWL